MNLKSFLKIVLVVNLCIQAVFAEDTVKYLLKDDKAPYTGYLFTPDMTNELKNAVIERDGYKLINDSLNKSLKLEQENVSLFKDQKITLQESNDKLAKELYDARSTSTWERMAWFALGVVATGFAFYGAKQISK